MIVLSKIVNFLIIICKYFKSNKIIQKAMHISQTVMIFNNLNKKELMKIIIIPNINNQILSLKDNNKVNTFSLLKNKY